MANLRQSVVMRKDLGMSAGLAAAQAAHLNDMWLRERMLASRVVKPRGTEGKPFEKVVKFEANEYDWLSAPVLSVLAVDTPEELDVIIKRAKDVGVAYRVWKDTIPSNVLGAPGKPCFLDVVVGISVGPDDDELIKQVTGGLPLF